MGYVLAAILAAVDAGLSMVGAAISETFPISKTLFYISMSIGIVGALLMGFVFDEPELKLHTLFGGTLMITTGWTTAAWAKLVSLTIGSMWDRGQLLALSTGGAACFIFWLMFLVAAYGTILDLVKDTSISHARPSADVESPTPASTTPSYRQTSADVDNAVLHDAIANCTQRLLTKRQLKEACRRYGLDDDGNKEELANRLVASLGIETVQRNIPNWSRIRPSQEGNANYKPQTPSSKFNKPYAPGVLFTDEPSTPSSTGGTLSSRPSSSSPSSDCRSSAKDVLLAQSTFHLMEVSRAFGLNCSAADRREEIAEKILDVLGPETVLAEFRIESLSSTGGSPSSAKSPATPSPTAPPPPAAAPDARPSMECTICLEPMGPGAKDVGVGNRCGHSACFECFCTAVREQRRCPICRREMAVTDVIKLFV